jgi:hypothetical protein
VGGARAQGAGVNGADIAMSSNNEQCYFVPATPGFSEPEYISEDTGGPAVSRMQVVAWQIVPCGLTSDGDPRYRGYPVTVHNDRRWQVDLPIVCPDGVVRTAGKRGLRVREAMVRRQAEARSREAVITVDEAVAPLPSAMRAFVGKMNAALDGAFSPTATLEEA